MDHRLSDYDREKIRRDNQANLPAFWLAYPVVVFGGLWLLTRVLDWIG